MPFASSGCHLFLTHQLLIQVSNNPLLWFDLFARGAHRTQESSLLIIYPFIIKGADKDPATLSVKSSNLEGEIRRKGLVGICKFASD